ncbi:MAG: phosphonate C-P lyase system protein PhnG [Leptolyngbya foveolarum]|uniref:Phosphonate C-P lyase system protein PhnG n=1 Tax=Leptolyngbya foveolarum TaxID=47253 RepID=A0A2W4TY43_9CYAN|nr:MAG: phosphonate C-P lyase system protein PhnG [Leptolyngbya foveolarum]
MQNLAERQAWMGTLAKASPAELENCVSQLGDLPAYSFLRSPEIGLAMVRGRAGGVGDAFNLGEMTLTRCVVSLDIGEMAGFGYVGGRSPRHAELAALCDALLQQEQWHSRVTAKVIEPLRHSQQQSAEQQQQQTAATQVEFFTMRRGE